MYTRLLLNSFSPLIFTNNDNIMYTRLLLNSFSPLIFTNNYMYTRLLLNSFSPLIFTNNDNIMYTRLLLNSFSPLIFTHNDNIMYTRLLLNSFSPLIFTNNDKIMYTRLLLNSFSPLIFTNNYMYTRLLLNSFSPLRRGQECRETNPLKQMEEFGVRLENTISALKLIDDNNRRSRTESMTSDIVRKTVRMSGVSKESTHRNLALEEFKLTSWESVIDAYNTSGNWSPEYLTGAAKQSTPGLVSGSSGQRDDRWSACGQYGGFSLDARSRTFSAHSSLVSYNEAMRKVKGMAEQGTRKIQCQPFRSHGAADCSWDRWLRGLSPPTKSLSMGENEVTTQTKSGGLGVIAEQEFSQTEQATATPVARAGMPQISQNQMVCDSAATGRYIESINSSQSQRTLCVPLHTPKGRTSSGSLDRSSNKSATSYVLSPSRPAGSSKVAFFEKESPKDRELLPALTKSSHNQTKRPLPSTRPDRWLPLAESGSLLRVSNRIKQQMADAARLYYLSSHAAAADQADPKCGIYWDHGCFLTAPRLQCKRGETYN